MNNNNTETKNGFDTTSASDYSLKIVNSVDAMLAYWDKNQVCRFANTAYLKWFGKTRDEMINKITLKELLGELYEMNKPYIQNALSGKKQVFERQITLPTGEKLNSMATYYPDIVNNEVRGFVAHVTDVTPIKQMEKKFDDYMKNSIQ